MNEFIEALFGRTRELILEEEDVIETLKVVNESRRWFIRHSLSVDTCGWEDQPTKWAIYFNATTIQWSEIIGSLMDKGFSLVIRDHTERIHLIRNKEASR